MSSVYIAVTLRQQIEERAHYRCEYCQTQELIIGMPLEVEHIIPFALKIDKELSIFAPLTPITARCQLLAKRGFQGQ